MKQEQESVFQFQLYLLYPINLQVCTIKIFDKTKDEYKGFSIRDRLLSNLDHELGATPSSRFVLVQVS